MYQVTVNTINERLENYLQNERPFIYNDVYYMIKYALFLWLMGLVAFSHPMLTAQSVRYLGIEQGLSNNSVNCIYKDNKGFMWMGTYDGLNKYDGYKFTHFKNRISDTSSLLSNNISTICGDTNNSIWVGTAIGVSIYHPATELFTIATYTPRESNFPKKVTAEIRSIKKIKNGSMLVATAANGLLAFNSGYETGKQVPLVLKGKKVFNYPVNEITLNHNNNEVLLFISNTGLCRYDPVKRLVVVINETIRQVNCMVVDRNNNIWLGKTTGIAKYSLASNAITAEYEIGINKIVTFSLGKDGLLWMGTNGKGILKLHLQTAAITPLAPGGDKKMPNSLTILNIEEDEAGRKWIGTLRGGVNIIDPGANPFVTYVYKEREAENYNPGFNSISSFCEDMDGEIWIGTSGWGLRKWNRKTNSYHFFSHIPGNNQSLGSNLITNILRDKKNNIWVSSWYGGINRFNRATGTFTKYSCFNPNTGKEESQVWFLYEDNTGTIWAGTTNEGTLYYLNKATNRFELYDQRIKNPQCMREDNKGIIWVGNYNSLMRIDRVNKKLAEYPIGHTVRNIYEDKLHNFWVGTQGGGLLLFDRSNGSFKRYNEDSGLQAGTILRIEEDEHANLWMSSFTGLIKYNAATKQFIRFSSSDGLQSNQFNTNGSLSLQSGEMMFGGINGFQMFYPDSVKIKQSNPRVYLSQIQVNGHPLNQHPGFITNHKLDRVTEITVPYDEAYLAFDFVAPEYSAPDKIQYSYFMEGWDKGYSKNISDRSAVYSRMHEGTYYFKVKTTGVWGIWGKETQLLTVIILAPWYRTGWAYLLYFIAISGSIFVYTRYKKKQAHMKYQVLLADLQVKKEEELNEKKLSFFTNVAHEFRTPLTLIINPIRDMLKTSDEEAPNQALDIIYRNARRLMSLVNQLLLFRKAEDETAALNAEMLNFVEVCRDVYVCFVQQATVSNRLYEFICDETAIPMYIDREKMEVCIFNLISNAMKYTPEGGRIKVKVAETPTQVILTVEDNGAGIPDEGAAHLFEKFYQVQGYGRKSQNGFGIGLYLVKKFVEMHDGSITYTTAIGKGTSFNIQLLKQWQPEVPMVIGGQHRHQSSLIEELVEVPQVAASHLVPVAPPQLAGVSAKKLMLVIDDNEQIREYLVTIFSAAFTLHQAADGDQGWKMIRQLQPDMIISDIRMPGINGLELCRLVKTDAALKHIPFILLTGSVGEEARLKGIEGGADDYISKPFEKDILVAKVNSIVLNRNNLQQYFFNEITHAPNTLKISGDDKAFIESCISIVENNLGNDEFNVKIFAAEIGMSHSNLYKRVKAVSGQSINSFIRFIRLRKAAELLINTPANVNEVAFQVGINDLKYFRQQFFNLFGVNPSDYIKKYRKVLGNTSYRFNVERKTT